MLIDRYIFLEWLKVFCLVLAATLGLLLLGDIYDSLPDLLDLGASGEEILRFYLVSIPSRLPLLIPITLLLSVLFSLGLLHRNHEITALRSAGCSLFRISRSLWLLGILFSALTFFLQSTWVPWSVDESSRMEDQLTFRHQQQTMDGENAGIAWSVSFDNRTDQRVWFMNRFSTQTLQGYGVTVSLLDNERREVQRIIAREAYFDYLGHRAWIFREGRLLTFKPGSREWIGSEPFEVRMFPEIQEDPNLMLALIKPPKDLSLRELRLLLEKLPAQDQPYRNSYLTRFSAIWASTITSLMAIALAIPFAVRGVRVNPAVNISKAIILFFCYYFLSNFFLLMGERGIFSPMLAAWIPNILGITMAAWLLLRESRVRA